MSLLTNSANPSKREAYKRKVKKATQRTRELTLASQEIAPLPKVVNPHRRAACDQSFKLFCETYFPKLFFLGWSDDHLRVIEKMERVVLYGETFAVAMPRGNGKTTLAICCVLWAILTGRHKFVYLISSADKNAKNLLVNIQNHLAGNELLLEDYPEVCYPIKCIEGETRRCKGQRYYGRTTDMEFNGDELVMPTIPGSDASGAVIRVSGLTGNFRGATHVLKTGESIRPTLVVCDDPQTDESAKSLVQTADRLKIINGAVIGLAGPNRKTGVIVPCTVISPDDLSDQLLNRKKYPAWRGERTKLVYKWPENHELWRQYGEIRKEELERGGDGSEALEFYKANREDMDEGAEVSWEERYYPEAKEISAIQCAYNLRFDHKEEVFASEYQNEPLLPADQQEAVTADQVCNKANGRDSGEVPINCTKLVAFVDVHDQVLFYSIMAFQENFTGYIIEYGTFPDQRVSYFTLNNAKHTLSGKYPGKGIDGAIQAGLEHLVRDLLSRNFKRGQSFIRIDRLLVDMGYKDKIVAAVKVKCGGSTMMLSKGIGITASGKPISTYKRKAGEVFGHHWYIPQVQGTQEFPHVNIDTNYWKSFVHNGFRTSAGDPTAITIYGKSINHELLADHIANSEFSVLTHGRGRDVREWKPKPSRPDNHWFDCITGCCAAGSMLGLKAPGHSDAVGKRPDKSKKMSEIQKNKRLMRHNHGR